MRGAERVIYAFGALGKTGKTATLTDRADLVAPAGENFMRLALMPDIPDQTVIRRIEHGVNGDGQFDNAKTRAKMATGGGHGIDRFTAQFVGKLFQLRIVKAAHIRRGMNPVEKGRGAVRARCRLLFRFCHSASLYPAPDQNSKGFRLVV